MLIFDRIDRFALWRERQGDSLGYVASLGALHDGHASLISDARKADKIVVVSLFVNPIQFGPTEDFETYPRTLDADLDFCRHHGVDAVFAPTAREMYPHGFETVVSPRSKVARCFEGASRPEHFDGVCTVVLKLFNIIRPSRTYFGQKDIQQLLIVRRMVEDLNISVEVITSATARADDGLALSSRNQYLSPDERGVAHHLYRSLRTINGLFIAGRTDTARALVAAKQELASHALIEIEYLDVIDPNTFESKLRMEVGDVVLGSIRLPSVRLIDNLILS